MTWEKRWKRMRGRKGSLGSHALSSLMSCRRPLIHMTKQQQAVTFNSSPRVIASRIEFCLWFVDPVGRALISDSEEACFTNQVILLVCRPVQCLILCWIKTTVSTSRGKNCWSRISPSLLLYLVDHPSFFSITLVLCLLGLRWRKQRVKREWQSDDLLLLLPWYTQMNEWKRNERKRLQQRKCIFSFMHLPCISNDARHDDDAAVETTGLLSPLTEGHKTKQDILVWVSLSVLKPYLVWYLFRTKKWKDLCRDIFQKVLFPTENWSFKRKMTTLCSLRFLWWRPLPWR